MSSLRDIVSIELLRRGPTLVAHMTEARTVRDARYFAIGFGSYTDWGRRATEIDERFQLGHFFIAWRL